MNCRNCGSKMEKDWEFCPRCGGRVARRDIFGSMFGDIFSRVDKEIQRMHKMFDIEARDLSPFFKMPKEEELIRGVRNVSGFSIKMEPGKPPQVRTFGNVKPGDVKIHMQQLGVRPKIERTPQAEAPAVRETKTITVPKITEEPKTHVKRTGSAVEVDIELPSVKSKDDIEIREFENSVEVKAVAGDKAYFKILTKPGQFGVKSRKFEKGILHLELY